MKSLIEHNINALKRYEGNILGQTKAQKNDLSCPTCGEELYDTLPLIVLTSNPPKVGVHCNYCQFTGYRIIP